MTCLLSSPTRCNLLLVLLLFVAPLAEALSLRFRPQSLGAPHVSFTAILESLLSNRSEVLAGRLPVQSLDRTTRGRINRAIGSGDTDAALDRLQELAAAQATGRNERSGAVRLGFAPDVELESRMTLCQLVQRRGFGCEEHFATTDDGYILGLFHVFPAGWRRPANGAEPRPAVLLMHGFLDSSFTWISNFAHQSLAYILVAAGYDVWLGNVRGNMYSRNNTRLRPDEKQFWWFTFDEFARQDLNASTAFVLKQTGQQKLNYVGHSQGTTIMFAALSRYPDIAARVRVFAALGPVARVGHLGGIYRYMNLSYVIALLKTLEAVSTGEILPNNALSTMWARDYCGVDAETADSCVAIIEALNGFGETCNATRVPVYVSHAPAGSSVLNVVHWTQQVLTDQFQMMDWGEAINRIKYHQPTPPLYNPANIQTRVALFSSARDWFANPVDVAWLESQLPAQSLIFHGHYDHYSHVGFIWSTEAHGDIYRDVLVQLGRYNL